MSLKLLFYWTSVNVFFRDGQWVSDDKLGGVVTNLHQPGHWDLYDQFAARFPSEHRVFYAIGCHPKEANLLSNTNLKRLEDMLQKPRVVAVGECGLDYSAR